MITTREDIVRWNDLAMKQAVETLFAERRRCAAGRERSRAEGIEAAIARAVCAMESASAAYNTHCEAVVSALNEARSGDASWSQQPADYTKGKRDALRDLLGSPNTTVSRDAGADGAPKTPST